MSQPIDTAALNSQFLSLLDTPDGLSKVAAASGRYIRDRLREDCVVDKILPPEPVTPSDCQVSESHDTLVRLVHVEPQSRAMSITFRGQPTARYVRAPRVAIPFYTISSEKLEKTEQELMAYGDMPVTKILEENMVKDMQEIKDRTTLQHFESAVQATQREANGGVFTRLNVTNNPNVRKVSIIKGRNTLLAGVNDGTVYAALRPDFINLFNLLDRNRLKSDLMVMTEPDYNNVLSWTLQDLGDKVASETVVDGWTYNTILGKKFIRTIKTDIFREGNVWLFTKPDFFGRSYILNNTKFYIDKIANLILWQSWMDVGVGIVNIAAVRKLELYGLSVTPTQTDVGFETKLPVNEEDLGALNNRVDAGVFYPTVHQF